MAWEKIVEDLIVMIHPESRCHGEVLRVLNSVDHMISNVHYVYPGMMCETNTFAYVSPRLETLK